MKDNFKTDVIFLMEKPLEDLEPNVFAFFPKEKYSNEPNLFYCYAHLGQHSSCHIDYAKECKKATKKQYQDLANELTQLGYNLNIKNKF